MLCTNTKEGSGTMYALIREYKNLDPTMRENAARKAGSELRPILSKSQG
jgi:hypothetical protein